MILDINFNRGDFYISGNPTTEYFFTLVTIIVTALVTSILSIICQRLYDNYKKNESLDDLYYHIKRQVIILNDAAIKYANNLEVVGTSLRKKEVENFAFTPLSDFDVDLILDWKTTNFYHSVVSRRFNNNVEKEHLIKNCGIIRSSLNSYRKNEVLIIKMLDDFNVKYQRHQDDWSERINEFQNIFNSYLPASPNDIFIRQLQDILNAWAKNGKNQEKSNVYEIVVEPALKVCNVYNMDGRVYAIRRELTKARDAYIEIKNDKEVYGKFCIDASKALNTVKDKLNSVFDEIDKFQTKSKWQFYVENID